MNHSPDDNWIQALKPVQRSTLSQHAYENLLQFILTGKISPGQHLVEQKLADQLQVSRISVREAIRQLSANGLVKIIPNSGAFVIQHNIKDIEEIFQLRAALEVIAVERLFEMDRAERLKRLQKLKEMTPQMEAVEADQDRLQGSHVDLLFHSAMMRISGHNKAIQIWEQMSAQIQVIVYNASRYFPTFEGFAARHQEIIELCRIGSGSACTAHIKTHILDGGQQLIRALPNLPPGEMVKE